MNAVGRTINTRFDLDKNYRNTREILKVAAEFVSTNGEPNDPESALQIVRPNPDIALRSGPAPEMLTASTAGRRSKSPATKVTKTDASTRPLPHPAPPTIKPPHCCSRFRQTDSVTFREWFQ